MATGMEVTIFQNLLSVFGGSEVLFTIFATILMVTLLILLKLPMQLILPFVAIMFIINGALIPLYQGFLWLIAGVVIAVWLYRQFSGGY